MGLIHASGLTPKKRREEAEERQRVTHIVQSRQQAADVVVAVFDGGDLGLNAVSIPLVDRAAGQTQDSEDSEHVPISYLSNASTTGWLIALQAKRLIAEQIALKVVQRK